MTQQDSFMEWLAKSNNKPNWPERYDQCIRAIREYLETTESLKGIFAVVKERGYFPNFDSPDSDREINTDNLLNDLRTINAQLDKVGFENSSDDQDVFYSYQDPDGNTRTLTRRYWHDIRTTALDEYARYLLGFAPAHAVQADHIRHVYQPHIEQAKTKRLTVALLSAPVDGLTHILKLTESAIAKALSDKNYRQKLNIKKVVVEQGRIIICFDLKSMK